MPAASILPMTDNEGSTNERLGFKNLISLDFLISLSLVLTFLATMRLGPPMLVCFYGLSLAYSFIHFKEIFSNLALWFLMIFAGYGAITMLWSVYPSTTLYYSIQTALTILAGVVIGSSRRPEQSLLGVAVGFILFTIASLIFGSSAQFEAGEVVFIGLTNGKNAFGEVTVFTIIFAWSLVLIGNKNKDWFLLFVGVLGLIIGVLGQLKAHSTGTLAAGVIAITTIIVLAAYSYVPKRIRTSVTIYLVIAILCFGTVFFLFKDPLIAKFLELNNKNETLTGRTDLWYTAEQIIRGHYWFGNGQYAFWVKGNPDAERIWTEYFILGRTGFNFHNSYYEIMVGGGIVGLSIFSLNLLFLLIRQFGFSVQKPNIMRLCWLGVCFYFICRMGFEAIVPGPMGSTTFLMSAALSLWSEKNYLRFS